MSSGFVRKLGQHAGRKAADKGQTGRLPGSLCSYEHRQGIVPLNVLVSEQQPRPLGGGAFAGAVHGGDAVSGEPAAANDAVPIRGRGGVRVVLTCGDTIAGIPDCIT